MMHLIYLLLTALVSADWHRKGVGIPLNSAYIPNTNQTILVSDEFVAKISEDGELVWRQILQSQDPKVQATAEYALVLNNNLLSAFNISNGGKEWTYPQVNSFAVNDSSIIIEFSGQYAALKPTYSAGHLAVSHSSWTEIPDGYDRELHSCINGPMLVKNSKFYHLNETETRCNSRKPDLVIEQEVVSLKDKWSLHEGLSNGEAACILSRLHKTGKQETWRERAARHSSFKFLDPSYEENLLVVATKAGSIYGINEKSGKVEWFHHGLFSNGSRLYSDEDLAIIDSNGSKTIISFEGKVIGNILNAKHGFRYETRGGRLHGYNNSQQTWSYAPENMVIQSTHLRGNLSSSSIATQVGPNDHLYKYLNPNLLAVLAENSTNIQLELLDAISGRHLGSVMHTKVGTTSLPLECTMGENWIAYSIGTKLHVLELFETSTLNTRRSHPSQSSYTDTLVPYIVESKRDLLQQVKKLAAINTARGSGSGLLICSGNTLEILPQRNFPSQPASVGTALDSLSKHAHVHSITLVAAKATRFESTVAVAALGKDIFYSFSDPVGTFDRLPGNFSFSGVLISLFILSYLAYQLSTSHMQATSQLSWS